MNNLSLFKTFPVSGLVKKIVVLFPVLLLGYGMSIALAGTTTADDAKTKTTENSHEASLKEKAKEMAIGAMDVAKEVPARVREGIHAATKPTEELGKNKGAEQQDKDQPKKDDMNEEAYKKGTDKARHEIALKMLKDNKTPAEIAKYTGLSEEQIKGVTNGENK